MDPFEPIEVEEIPDILFRPGNVRMSKIDKAMESNPFEMIPEEESGFLNVTHRSTEENKKLFEVSKLQNVFTVDELSVINKKHDLIPLHRKQFSP